MATQFQCTTISVAAPAPILDITNLIGTDLGGGVVQLQWNQNIAANIEIKDNGVLYATIFIEIPGAQSVNLQGITPGEHTICVQKAA